MEGLPTENQESKKSYEVMPLPEIVIQEERGAQLFSLLLKAGNKEWGETETPLAKETTEYFEKNPLDQDILEIIKELKNQGVDEESFYNLALTYQHPERSEKVFELAAKYKPHIKDPQEVQRKVLTALESFDKTFSRTPLAEKFAEQTEQDKRLRIEKIDENKKRIKNIIDFFKPDQKTVDIQKVIFVPTDPLYKKNSGRSFSAFTGEQIIISNIDNTLNQDHEFCHGIINPIVEKLSNQLTAEQKEKISQLASGKLKRDYGKGHFSLLCEEFIRTYTEIVVKGERPQTYEDFAQKISGINNNQFMDLLSQSESLKIRCAELNIASIEDLKDKSKEYFERFEKNQLRDLIFNIYQEYTNRSDKEVNFEQFVMINLPLNL
jgi:hypothetical protein